MCGLGDAQTLQSIARTSVSYGDKDIEGKHYDLPVDDQPTEEGDALSLECNEGVGLSSAPVLRGMTGLDYLCLADDEPPVREDVSIRNRVNSNIVMTKGTYSKVCCYQQQHEP